MCRSGQTDRQTDRHHIDGRIQARRLLTGAGNRLLVLQHTIDNVGHTNSEIVLIADGSKRISYLDSR